MDRDIAFYHKATDEEKAKYWRKELDTEYYTMSKEFCRTFEHASRCVEAYQNAETKSEKAQLWLLYDTFTRSFCDYEKWKHEKREKRHKFWSERFHKYHNIICTELRHIIEHPSTTNEERELLWLAYDNFICAFFIITKARQKRNNPS